MAQALELFAAGPVEEVRIHLRDGGDQLVASRAEGEARGRLGTALGRLRQVTAVQLLAGGHVPETEAVRLRGGVIQPTGGQQLAVRRVGDVHAVTVTRP